MSTGSSNTQTVCRFSLECPLGIGVPNQKTAPSARANQRDRKVMIDNGT